MMDDLVLKKWLLRELAGDAAVWPGLIELADVVTDVITRAVPYEALHAALLADGWQHARWDHSSGRSYGIEWLYHQRLAHGASVQMFPDSEAGTDQFRASRVRTLGELAIGRRWTIFKVVSELIGPAASVKLAADIAFMLDTPVWVCKQSPKPGQEQG